MAKRKDFKFLSLPPETIIDVVALRGDEVYVKTMSISEYGRLKKAKGWIYRLYQVGFHSFKSTQ